MNYQRLSGPGGADSHRSYCAGFGFLPVSVCDLLIFHILLRAKQGEATLLKKNQNGLLIRALMVK